jgi:hypothetical protein
VEAAIKRDERFSQHRKPVQYLYCYRTLTGQVFAFERVTKTQIRFWLPASEAVRTASEKAGLTITKSLPNMDRSGDGGYGRISSLKAIPELRDATLYTVPVMSADQALTLVAALY